MLGFVKRLFGFKKEENTDNLDLTYSVEMTGPHFTGENKDELYEKYFIKARSKSGKYVIHSGSYTSYLIRKNGNTVKVINIENVAHRGFAISDEGTSVFLESISGSLRTNILIFPLLGERKVIKVGANTSGISFSPDGALCITQAYRSDTEDSCKTIIFDANKGEVVSKFYSPVEGEKHILLRTEEEGYKILFSSPTLGNHIATLQGELEDHLAYVKAKWDKSSYPTIIRMIEDEIKSLQGHTIPESRLNQWFESLARIHEDVTANNSTYKPHYYRVLGKCHDLRGNYPEAIELYGKALQASPKIGVKRRYDYLSKKVG